MTEATVTKNDRSEGSGSADRKSGGGADRKSDGSADKKSGGGSKKKAMMTDRLYQL